MTSRHTTTSARTKQAPPRGRPCPGAARPAPRTSRTSRQSPADGARGCAAGAVTLLDAQLLPGVQPAAAQPRRDASAREGTHGGAGRQQ